MAGGSNYLDPSTHPRLGTGVQYHDPDFDSPWWCHNVTLPNDARCETCAYWVCGICGLDTRRVKLPEDRCMAWTEHPAHRSEVKARGDQWTEAEMVSDKVRWDRRKRQRQRIEKRAGAV